MMKKLFTLSVYMLLACLSSWYMPALQAAPNDDFGRLFSRQSERKNLDVLRQNQKLKMLTPQVASQPETSANATAELPEPVTLQGYVKRSDGSATVWINHKAVQENSTVDNVEIGRLSKQKDSARHGSDNLSVRIPATGKKVQLKAGQVYEPDTNQVRELQLLEKEKQLNLEETGAVGD